jgi:hypothetical protein
MADAGWAASFAGVQPAANKTIPSGPYLMRITELEWGQVQSGDNEGAEKLTVTFKVTEGEHTSREQRRVYTFSEKALPFFLQLCTASGKIPTEVLEGKVKVTPKHVAEMRNAVVVVQIRQSTAIKEQDKEYADDDGKINRITGIYALDSTRGKMAKAALKKDPLAPR